MKPRQDTTVTAVNVPQLKPRRLFATGSGHIIEMLINQYSHPVRSAREHSDVGLSIPVQAMPARV